MLVEVLSDHPGAGVRETATKIRNQQVKRSEHLRAVAGLAKRYRWWQIWAKVRQRRQARALTARAPAVDPRLRHRLAQQTAGVVAEDEMTAALRMLSDDWLLFRGYANRRGEVDHLVVGPTGVWAIEVKGRGVTVHVHGDRWRYDKFDRYGNLVEQGPLEDRTGRSWGRQVTDIAGELQNFLRSRGAEVTVATAVVVIHDRARLGSARNPGTVLSVGTRPLLDRVRKAPVTLDAATRNTIARLIRRDHTFHAARRARRRTR